MRSATVEDRDAFLSIDINVLCDGWGVSGGRFCDCSSGKVYPCCISELEKDSTREIIRIGSNFFYK